MQNAITREDRIGGETSAGTINGVLYARSPVAEPRPEHSAVSVIGFVDEERALAAAWP
jgi:hypothetical protein